MSIFSFLFGRTPVHPAGPEVWDNTWNDIETLPDPGPDSLEKISDDLVEIVWRLQDVRDATAKTLAETRARCDALVAEHNRLVAEVNRTEQLRLSVAAITAAPPPSSPPPEAANDDEPTAAAPVQTLAVLTGSTDAE